MKKRIKLEDATEFILNELHYILDDQDEGSTVHYYDDICGYGKASVEGGYLIVEGSEIELEGLPDNFEEV